MQNISHKALIVLLAASIFFLSGLIVCIASHPHPNLGIPMPPKRGLPKVTIPQAPAKPDISFSSSGSGLGLIPERYPDDPGMGTSRFFIIGQVLNGGTVASRGCQVDLNLSMDRKASPDDSLLKRIIIPKMILNFDGDRYGSVLLPRTEYGIPADTFSICGKVNPLKVIAKKNENNNGNSVPEAMRKHVAGAKRKR